MDSINTMLAAGITSCVVVILLVAVATIYNMWLTKIRHNRWMEINPPNEEE